MRRLPALLAAVVVLAAGCGDTVSAAVRVGDTRISDDELIEEVEEWGGNESALPADLFAANQDLGEHALAGDLVRPVTQQRIDFELHRIQFEELGLELSAEARNQAAQVYFGDEATAERVLEGFSDDYADRFVDDVARQLLVESELGDDYLEWRIGAAQEAGVEVSSRYGRWNEERQAIEAPRAPDTTFPAP